MQSTQVHNSQPSGYHAHPPPASAGYPGGIQQHYKTDSQNGVNGDASSQDMYYQQQHLQQQQQQHAQYQHHPQQQLPHQQQPGYPGMQSSIPQTRMPPPGQAGMLPPLYPGMSAPGMPGMGGPPSMPPSLSSQQPMYGAPSQSLAPPPKTEARQMSFSGVKGDYKYTLVVEQQPQRARMCGFGDKDRRPITPPPCIRLVIEDKNTGEEIDYKDTDGSFFILQVDLWDKDAVREVNIVRASASSPAVSISTATTTSYPPQQERQMLNEFGQPVALIYQPDGSSFYAPAGAYGNQMYASQYAPPPQQSTAMYTRNLIGSLTVNASLLSDTDKKPGYWFVLQDLSVRTEGWFRLKMNFIDVGDPTGAPGLNRAKCPVLASVYSEPFQVYSAKKFPGVIESTPLSKTFASQGIKIPIRKEGKPDKNEDDED